MNARRLLYPLAWLPALMLLASAAMKLSHNPQLVQGFVAKYGFPESSLISIGVLELICTALYALPATSRIGALLLTAYLGGATAVHVRIGDGFAAPVLVGIFVWLGLAARDAEVRGMLFPFGRLVRAGAK